MLDRFFPHDGPAGTEEDARLRAYVLLTVLHDKELDSPGYQRIAEGIWPADADFVTDQWHRMTSDEALPELDCGWDSWHDEIDLALNSVKDDLERQKNSVGGKPMGTRENDGAQVNVNIQNSTVNMGDINQTQNLATTDRGTQSPVAIVASWLWCHIKSILWRIWKRA